MYRTRYRRALVRLFEVAKFKAFSMGYFYTIGAIMVI